MSLLLFGCVLLFASAQAIRLTTDAWGVKWAENGGSRFVTDGYIYVGLVGVTVAMHATRVFALLKTCTMSSINMHNAVFERVLHAPQSEFFDVTPTGEIVRVP